MYLEVSHAICRDQKLVEVASGKSRNTLWEWTSEAKGRPLQIIARKLWVERFPKDSTQATHRSRANSANDVEVQAPTLQDRQDWSDSAWDFFYTAETSGLPFQETTCRFELDDNQAEAMLERARALRTMKTQRSTPSQNGNLDLRPPTSRGRNNPRLSMASDP